MIYSGLQNWAKRHPTQAHPRHGASRLWRNHLTANRARVSSLPVAWLTIIGEEDNPEDFLHYLLAAWKKFILTCRSDPPLPVARYRAHRQLTELRTPYLRFTQAESREFLTCTLKLDLSPDLRFAGQD